MFALGMSNLVGSFFECFVCCGALARSAVFDSSGGRTQLVTVIASTILLSVLFWISPLLEHLPKACLGSIIIAALVNMFKQFKDIKHYWHIDKIDLTLWIVTFLSCLILDIGLGLCIGIISVFVLNTYRNQRYIITYFNFLFKNVFLGFLLKIIKIKKPILMLF
jgi:MFS superfamily sulfate permease-like transporter